MLFQWSQDLAVLSAVADERRGAIQKLESELEVTGGECVCACIVRL